MLLRGIALMDAMYGIWMTPVLPPSRPGSCTPWSEAGWINDFCWERRLGCNRHVPCASTGKCHSTLLRVPMQVQGFHRAPRTTWYSAGHDNDSGWMQEKDFLLFLEHFAKHTKVSPDKKVFRLLHTFQWKWLITGSMLLSLPPYTAHMNFNH